MDDLSAMSRGTRYCHVAHGCSLYYTVFRYMYEFLDLFTERVLNLFIISKCLNRFIKEFFNIYYLPLIAGLMGPNRGHQYTCK